MIELHPDFKDFLRLCENLGVSCLIVGCLVDTATLSQGDRT